MRDTDSEFSAKGEVDVVNNVAATGNKIHKPLNP